MSISLKTTNANEILESMVETLNDKEFVGLYKKAEEIGGLREHKSPTIKTQPSMQELYNIAKKYLGYKGSDDKVNDFIEFSNDKLSQDRAKEYSKTHLQSAEDTLLEQLADGVDPSTMEYSPENVEAIKEKLRLAKEEQEKKVLEQGKEIAQNVPVAENKLNKADDVALAYTIKNLTKLANALDVNGYANLANVVDEAIEKAASLKK